MSTTLRFYDRIQRTGRTTKCYKIPRYHKIPRYYKIPCKVYAIKNRFFGETVTVSGLITGKDIANQLKGRKLGTRLLIPKNMLRSGEDVFLDDMTVAELSELLNTPVIVVAQNGADLVKAIVE